MAEYKTINGLMKHMRANHVQIGGSAEKRNLINLGYFHGYKGYRYFRYDTQRVNFTSFAEVYKIACYDDALKSLFYGKLMFIETAVKNITLQSIVETISTPSLNCLLEEGIVGYKDFPVGTSARKRREAQDSKNKLRSKLLHEAEKAYSSGNGKISHYYESANHAYVPLWALFEIAMMGELDFILDSLKDPIRLKICKELDMDYSFDSDHRIVGSVIKRLRYLRNSVAHNNVVYDSRFNCNQIKTLLKTCLNTEMNLSNPTMSNAYEYVVLISLMLKKLGVPKTENKRFVRKFRDLTTKFEAEIGTVLATQLVPANWKAEINNCLQKI